MALTPTEEANYALHHGVSWSDLSLGAQIEYDRLVAEGYGTPPLAAASTWLPNLGVAIRNGNVYQHCVDQSGMHSDSQAMSERAGHTEMKLLGPLVGAHAQVLSPPSRTGFKVFVVLSFADGTVFDKKFDKKSTTVSSLIRAQGEAARFDTLAASHQPAEGFAGGKASGSAEGSVQGHTIVAPELGTTSRPAVLGPAGQ